MMNDLGQTLLRILSQPNLPAELADAQIVFDRPTGQFNPQNTTVNLFLHDIRENLDLRDNAPIVERDRTTLQATIQRPPLRMDCTYLVTAWPVTGQDTALQEHHLLGQVLQVLCRHPEIPERFWQGQLKAQSYPVPLMLNAGDRLKNPTEFWTSLGIPPRVSLSVTATLAIHPLPDPTQPLVPEPLVQTPLNQLSLMTPV
jgi:hypothetical protein